MDESSNMGSAINIAHRNEFNLAAFGTTFEGDETKSIATKVRRKLYTKQRYETIVNRLRYWDVVDGHVDPKSGVLVTQKQLRESCERSWYKEIKFYRLAPITTGTDNVQVEHLQYHDTKHDVWRVVVHQEMVFDAIHACHIAARHRKAFATSKYASQIYHNLTDDLIRIFVETCPLCKKTAKCEVIPFFSSVNGRFRDKFLGCTVDFSTTPALDSYGNTMEYLLVVRDEATLFTILRPIPKLDQRFIEYELKIIFSLFGFPTSVFGGDEETLFLSYLMEKVIHRWEPGCKKAADRTEELVSHVKRVISGLLLKAKEDDESHKETVTRPSNWVTLLPDAMIELNQKSYSRVFRMNFSSKTTTNIAEKDSKKDGQIDSELETMKKARVHVNTLDQKVASTDLNVDKGLIDNEVTGTDLDESSDSELESRIKRPVLGNTIDLKVPASAKNVDQDSSDNEVSGLDLGPPDPKRVETQTDSQAHRPIETNVSDTRDNTVLSKPQLGKATNFNAEGTSIRIALKDPSCQLIKIDGKSYPVVYPTVSCRICDQQTVHGTPTVAVAETSFYDCFMQGSRWWTADLIITFGVLKAHETHRTDMIFVDAGTPTRGKGNTNTSFPRPILPPGVEKILTVATRGNHFVVLLIKLYPDCTTVVFDEMATNQSDLRKWEDHQNYVLSRYGISKDMNDRKWLIRRHNPMHDSATRNDITQTDSYNCGPIACRGLWEL